LTHENKLSGNNNNNNQGLADKTGCESSPNRREVISTILLATVAEPRFALG
jgi:hypothetical protein